METVWSEHIQGTMTLYTSRRLRFHDRFREQYTALFGLADGPMRILEIGCGPGALAEALQRWYPKAEITGLDRDVGFLEFARERVPGVAFLKGDATALPFAESSFDVVISNTVQEHVEPSAFFGEQLRVLRPGGVCLVLSSRRGLHVTAPCLEWDEAERSFWEKVSRMDDTDARYGVCRYPMNEAELPAAMEKYGFRRVSVGYAAADQTPDDPRVPPELGMEMIDSGRYNDLEALELTVRSFGDRLDADEAALVRRRIEDKYYRRKEQYRRGEKQWETTVSLIMAVRGEK